MLDVSIVRLRWTKLFTTVIPSKLFECMGIPVLHDVAGECARIVEKEGAGIVFEPESADALCDCVARLAEDRTLYDQCRNNALTGAQNYDRSVLVGRMLRVLEGVLE